MMRICLPVFLACVLAILPAVHAVVIDSVSGDGNTSAPADDPGWSNLGILGSGVGIYLGNGWVLTASQIGAGSISLGGISYDALPGSTVQLTNALPAKTTYTDLIMFRLASTPLGLGPLTLATSGPSAGESVTMIGAGRDRGDFTEWNINTATTPWSWTEVSSGGNAAGYQTVPSRTMRWGTNAVAAAELWVNFTDAEGSFDVKSFGTRFDAGNPSSEAQAVLGDFGGAVFTRKGSGWELGGVMFTVAGFSGQPSADLTPVYGDETFSADISFYAPQIIPLIPEPSTYALILLAGVGLVSHVVRLRCKTRVPVIFQGNQRALSRRKLAL